MNDRLGAYVLAGDPEWLRSSLSRYYEWLDDLVVLVPQGALGWTGRTLPVEACLTAVREIDTRGIARLVTGSWVNRRSPICADTEQRQAGLDALSHCTWVVQLDNDEVIPDFEALLKVAASAPPTAIGIEWPMRVLFRRLQRTSFLAISSESRTPVYEYPGSVLVKPIVTLEEARRPRQGNGTILRCLMPGDHDSLQVKHAPAHDEERVLLSVSDLAILHNSWGRSPASVWKKIRTWGHSSGTKIIYYFFTIWLPSPWTWRSLHDVHPFARDLWPRLERVDVDSELLHPADG